jgi:hypothetical protein
MNGAKHASRSTPNSWTCHTRVLLLLHGCTWTWHALWDHTVGRQLLLLLVALGPGCIIMPAPGAGAPGLGIPGAAAKPEPGMACGGACAAPNAPLAGG